MEKTAMSQVTAGFRSATGSLKLLRGLNNAPVPRENFVLVDNTAPAFLGHSSLMVYRALVDSSGA